MQWRSYGVARCGNCHTNHFCGRLGVAEITKMQRRLPQFWSNTTNSTTDTVATDDSDDRIRV